MATVYFVRIKPGKISTRFIWILAILLLVSSGITYRLLASHMELLFDTPTSLSVPLSAFPTQIGNWVGRDLAIPNITKEYMEENFADDFLSRRYVNSATGAWADVYVVYCSSRPGGILGHRPQVCYPANGWIHDVTEQSQFISNAGRQMPCLIHRFHKPYPVHEQTVVLNFYILNGQLTADENDFSGPWGRRPNIAGYPARYVAQVQISSVLKNSIRTAAKDMTDLILDFLPGENRRVRATKYSNTPISVLK
ncbi:MAG: exosortase-associated EpsI family protein [Planctomycetes bacterium]|nr:exosortase-associated EpsI family protein [Planctomycetota bacterium]